MALSVENLNRMKQILRETDCPFFTDSELDFYASENGYNINNALYQCLIIKAEDTTLKVSGLNCGDTSKYYRRLASKYRKNNSGTLT